MAKAKVTYVCGECGYESAGWLGKCPECSVWDSFLEMKVGTGPNNAKGKGAAPASGGSAPVLIGEIPDDEGLRFPSGYAETDRVLGGGFVPGSLTLLGGDPGIGKSTLALQICRMVDERLKTLYVSGEESLRQIKMR
ncbi:MAG: DNA repair protein RadA, partial [Oscillospiraceae bacterium]|nr:DNA repair protein RadA [Oscillospiraceae bacterium]